MVSFDPMAKEYLTKKDLMAYLKISLPTVNRLMLDGIPYMKLRGKVLFRLDLVDAWLEAKMKGQRRPKS
ncbi:MAG: helix-turn-helix domain-containing protein [Acidobacteria bacterium]|nr:helix-turn-helix domain-containing protein [Acidobacteriota bacterium]